MRGSTAVGIFLNGLEAEFGSGTGCRDTAFGVDDASARAAAVALVRI